MLKLFNTMSRQKEIFKPLGKFVKIYTCGPTVYDYPHIGNYRAYMVSDILRRYLKYLGYQVKHVMNITDVDDKTIRNSQKAGVSLKEFTKKYEKAFFEDLKTLNIERVEVYPRATEHIKEMVSLVKTLLEKGYAYKGKDGSIYFSIKKFKDYGKLARLKPEELKAGASGVMADEYGKENVRDFALWKAWVPADGDVFWETEIGKGRPGWHLECSAMSMKYLGETLDIHTGGVDLIFPHHENEIAQSEAATGKKFVRYWVHNEHLLVEGQKMSKSLGNFYTLRELLKKGAEPKAIRFILLSTHYRRQLNFTFEELEAATKTVNKLLDFMDRLKELKVDGHYDMLEEIRDAEKKFNDAMDDDLSVPEAIAAIFELVSKTNKAIEERKISAKGLSAVYETMKKFDKVLGLLEHEKEEVPKEIKTLLKEREEARKKKDFARADEIRNKIREMGWAVEDTPSGPRVRKISL